METSVKSSRYWWVCGMAACSMPYALAETPTEEILDTEFLEYLGMWEESDEDWLVLEAVVLTDDDKRSDPAPESEESTEIEDED